jgi:uncharacterized protein (TIGR02466 family)
MEIQALFPTAIGFFDLGRDLTFEENHFILNQKQHSNEGNTTSDNKNILKSKELISIRDFIESSLVSYFEEVYKPKKDISIYITQSWSNYTEAGQFHHKHNHPNSIVSGVFYPFAKEEVDKIFFYKSVYPNIKINATDWNVWNSETWWYPVKTGGLILFPSSLTHMVPSKEGEETRVSIAFNTFLKGVIGNEDDLTGLTL